MNPQNFVWVEKYRPRTIESLLLPDRIKQIASNIISDENIPNLLLYGPKGSGKTSLARAMLEEGGFEYIVINSSLYGNIDTLRTDVQSFASTGSFTGKRKFVILDEADYLNPASTQPALRNFMEQYSANCGFILTANTLSKIMEPLQSRCALVDFNLTKEELKALVPQFLQRIVEILDQENIQYEKAAIVDILLRYVPDWRRVINELQFLSKKGSITAKDVVVTNNSETIASLIPLIRGKNYLKIRQWATDNVEYYVVGSFYTDLYDALIKVISEDQIPALTIIIADYQYKHNMVVDKEINVSACVFSIITECFK